jgi:hypothetical protein
MALFDTAERRRFRPALAWALGLTAIALIIVPAVLAPVNLFPRNEHSKASLDVALNLVLCHRAALQSTAFAPGRYLSEHPEDLDLAPAALIARSGIGRDAYCATLAQPITNNENSLMLMEAIIWLVRPSASVRLVGRVMAWLRVGAIAFFGLACLAAGASVALTLLLVCGAMAVQQSVGWLEYTVYPFLLSAPLVWVAICVMLYSPLGTTSTPRRIAWSVFGGILAGFGTNLRSSYLAMFVGLFALVLTACLKRWTAESGKAPALRAAALSLTGFIVGMWSFNAAVMRPLEHPAAGNTTNYTYHTVAHPLVMSLAVPENELSRSVNVRWDDMSARDLAQRVQPGVAYLGPEYERALYRFYLNLWRTRPREMVRTYVIKLQRTGRGVFLFASDLVPSWRPLRKIYLVWADRVNGSELVAAALVITGLSWWRLWRTMSTAALFAACMSGAVTLVLLESAFIYSEFTPMYHSFLLFAVLVGPAVLLQLIWDRLRVAVRS